jgi:hypothetical protein
MPHSFTLEMANRMLPLVSRIVRDVLDHYREWQQTVESFEMATALSRADHPSAEAEALQRQAQELAAEIQGFLAELTELGVEFKGFELGLVDFPGDVDGQQIMWCWKYGEPAVLYWHDVAAGYAGRQPVETILRPAGANLFTRA